MPAPSAGRLLALLLLLGCRRPPPPHTEAPPSPFAKELPTTDGAIAVGNLEAAIDGQLRAMELNPHPARLEALVGLYGTRAQYLGRLADYDRAAELAERLVRDNPAEGKEYLLRAETRAALHRFAAALEDLERAVRAEHKAKAHAVDALRASILQAQGKLDAALALSERQAQADPDIVTLGAVAALQGDRGDLARAEALFAEARRHYRDVSPFPVAWVFFQEGTMWQNAGRLGRARELFAEAHARLPAYAPATAHLASVLAATGATGATGDRAQAIALLRPLVSSSDDPEYPGQLAALLLEAGQPAEAAELREKARRGYEALLSRHPEAFASHAARFFLGAGDAKRALALAQQNLAFSAAPASFELALEAALAALPPAGACAMAERALGSPYPTARLHVLCARAFQACGRPDRAAAEVRAATPPP